MKILFLDIDGVLNSARSCRAFDGYPHDFSDEGMRKFDSVAIGLVRKLCDKTGALIVLSSTWRMLHDISECAQGLGLPIFDRTPILEGPRGVEINAWLSKHPEVTRYAIVDDDSDMLPEQKQYFVKTNFEEGLSMHDFKALLGLLSDSASKSAIVIEAKAA